MFADPEWASLGFSVVDSILLDGATAKLKLNKHPPTSELVTLLVRSPPEDEAIARQWFEVLSGRVPGSVLHLSIRCYFYLSTTS